MPVSHSHRSPRFAICSQVLFLKRSVTMLNPLSTKYDDGNAISNFFKSVHSWGYKLEVSCWSQTAWCPFLNLGFNSFVSLSFYEFLLETWVAAWTALTPNLGFPYPEYIQSIYREFLVEHPRHLCQFGVDDAGGLCCVRNPLIWWPRLSTNNHKLNLHVPQQLLATSSSIWVVHTTLVSLYIFNSTMRIHPKQALTCSFLESTNCSITPSIFHCPFHGLLGFHYLLLKFHIVPMRNTGFRGWEGRVAQMLPLVCLCVKDSFEKRVLVR